MALFSFQGGPLGASQDQVYEAMEIFGEGIQDFDLFKDVDGEDEVSQWITVVMASPCYKYDSSLDDCRRLD